MKKAIILGIRLYKMIISPILPARCRFYPTCSTYMIESIQEHGYNGLVHGVIRICKCHPWHPGGIDLVPKRRINT